MNKLCISLMCILILLLSCSEESIYNALEYSSSELTVDVSIEQAKGIQSETSLQLGAEIGLFAFKSSDNSVISNGTNNCYTYEEVSGARFWQTNNPVFLDESLSDVYAYAPFKAGVTSDCLLPFDIEDGIDYMYANKDQVNIFDKKANLTLNHAFAVLRLRVRKTADCNLSQFDLISINSSLDLIKTGTLDIRDGSITASTYVNTLARRESLVLKGEYQTIDILVPPTLSATSFLVDCKVDGSLYELQLSSLILLQGTVYSFTIDFDHNGTKIGMVQIENWIEGGNVQTSLTDKLTNIVRYVDKNGYVTDLPDTSCLGLVLALTNFESFMIYKNGYKDPAYKQAVDELGLSWMDEYQYFFWGDTIDYEDISNETKTGGMNLAGNMEWEGGGGFPMADGTYSSSQAVNQLTTNIEDWNSNGGLLGDMRSARHKSEVLENYYWYRGDIYSGDLCDIGYMLRYFNKPTVGHTYTDWSVPTIRQWAFIYMYLPQVQDGLRKIGGQPLKESGFYWSCNERDYSNAWVFVMQDAYIQRYKKTSHCLVRFVRDFNLWW